MHLTLNATLITKQKSLQTYLPLHFSFYSLSAMLYPLWTGVPPIPRPSNEEFLKYAEEGKTEQVAKALRYYPDLIDVRDKVIALWH